ncbi:Equilibrative nucleoside transporter [Cynara cardunculus var. scolymus]|uniref:Equilibrative nucleoside transporter n=1 Tax=Cynara cardunculus var. scolymus TaxID=59895 RepID=A0A103YBI4_CYNCS|nr:Equilibrative nucleoside transporter [Cynara cardunculus var. scolymus]
MESLHLDPPATDHQNEPKDPYCIAYIIHFLLGAGYLIPWNSFITAVDYFQFLYPAKHVSKVFSVAYMLASMTVLSILAWCSSSGKRKLPEFRVRMNLGYALFVLALVVTQVIDWVDHRNEIRGGSNAGFAVLVSMLVLTGCAEGLTGGSLVGATGKLPGRYMQAVVAGNASAASLPHSRGGLRTSTHIYFFTSILIELLCILCCNLLHKLPAIRRYTARPSHSHLDNQPKHNSDDHHRPKTLSVLKKLQWLLMSVVTIYVVTLSIFPGYLSENVKSTQFGDWYPLFLITIYNAGDFSGKCVTAVYVVKRKRWVIWGCMMRVLFYLLFFGCVFGPKWFRNEVVVVVLTLLLGVSNGYLTSVLMIVGPKSVEVEESHVAGIAMSLFLGIGLVIGSGLGWLWDL